MKTLIQKISEQHHLSRAETAEAMRTIMQGQATDAQLAALLIGLRLNGEQPEELLGFIEVMTERSVKIKIEDPNAIDMCGTGGDGSGSFNVSTVASFVVAGAGVTVAKHGNRSVSSTCGSADVLSALGVNIQLTPEMTEECVNRIGIGFLFAPLFHPSMKFATRTRTELGVRTCFNILGPMTNPAGVKRQVVGTFNQRTARLMAEVFSRMSPAKVCVLNAQDGLDEVSLAANTIVYEINGEHALREYSLNATTLGLPVSPTSMMCGGSPEANASIALRVLRGERGPHRNLVIANAALGIYVAGRTKTIQDGVDIAVDSIDSGRALQKLNQIREFGEQ